MIKSQNLKQNFINYKQIKPYENDNKQGTLSF